MISNPDDQGDGPVDRGAERRPPSGAGHIVASCQASLSPWAANPSMRSPPIRPMVSTWRRARDLELGEEAGVSKEKGSGRCTRPSSSTSIGPSCSCVAIDRSRRRRHKRRSLERLPGGGDFPVRHGRPDGQRRRLSTSLGASFGVVRLSTRSRPLKRTAMPPRPPGSDRASSISPEGGHLPSLLDGPHHRGRRCGHGVQRGHGEDASLQGPINAVGGSPGSEEGRDANARSESWLTTGSSVSS